MTGNTATPPTTATESPADTTTSSASATTSPAIATKSTATGTLTLSRAARQLELKRSEFTLAVNLGRVKTVRDESGGRVACEEIERLRAEEGFPDGLRERIEAVGTKDGADILEVPESRFTRLARLGLLVPVTFRLNRYRAVVWLYLAEELRQFAADPHHAPLLSGRTPESLREQMAAGADLRPRNWRGRHLGFLLRRAGGEPWARAAALTCLLDPVQVAEIVKDPYERAYLLRFRPGLPTHGAPGSPVAGRAQEIMTARDPDEIGWLRADLARALDEARHHRPAPRPAPKRHTAGARPASKPHATVPRTAPSHVSSPRAAGRATGRNAAGPVPDTTEPDQSPAVPDQSPAVPDQSPAAADGLRGLRGRLRRRGTGAPSTAL